MTEQELRIKEEALFAEWQAHQLITLNSKGFAKDGIVDFNEYMNARVKILFLLKEPNCHGEVKKTDAEFLRKGLKNGGREENEPTYWRNWQVIARWASHILSDSEVTWERIYSDSKTMKFRQENLRKVAIVNLKKNGGEAACNPKQLADYTKECGMFVRLQIDLYRPDLIVCNHNTWLLEKYVFSHKEREAHRWTKNDIRWFPLNSLNAWPCNVLDMWHFGARKSHKDLHFALVDAVHDINNASE